MGVDAAPEDARAPFLAGWRLVTGLGQSSGPVLVAGVVGAATGGIAATVVGALGLLGAAWLWRWLPRGRPAGPAPSAERPLRDPEPV